MTGAHTDPIVCPVILWSLDKPAANSNIADIPPSNSNAPPTHTFRHGTRSSLLLLWVLSILQSESVPFLLIYQHSNKYLLPLFYNKTVLCFFHKITFRLLSLLQIFFTLIKIIMQGGSCPHVLSWKNWCWRVLVFMPMYSHTIFRGLCNT